MVWLSKMEISCQNRSSRRIKKQEGFCETLQYEIIDAENLYDFTFTPYLEKGFKVGLHTSEETNIIKKSEFPFNLSYDRNKIIPVH